MCWPVQLSLLFQSDPVQDNQKAEYLSVPTVSAQQFEVVYLQESDQTSLKIRFAFPSVLEQRFNHSSVYQKQRRCRGRMLPDLKLIFRTYPCLWISGLAVPPIERLDGLTLSCVKLTHHTVNKRKYNKSYFEIKFILKAHIRMINTYAEWFFLQIQLFWKF